MVSEDRRLMTNYQVGISNISYAPLEVSRTLFGNIDIKDAESKFAAAKCCMCCKC